MTLPKKTIDYMVANITRGNAVLARSRNKTKTVQKAKTIEQWVIKSSRGTYLVYIDAMNFKPNIAWNSYIFWTKDFRRATKFPEQLSAEMARSMYRAYSQDNDTTIEKVA